MSISQPTSTGSVIEDLLIIHPFRYSKLSTLRPMRHFDSASFPSYEGMTREAFARFMQYCELQNQANGTLDFLRIAEWGP